MPNFLMTVFLQLDTGKEGCGTPTFKGSFFKTECLSNKEKLDCPELTLPAIYLEYPGTLTYIYASVADPDPGSGAFLTPGSGIRKGFIPDPGSQTHIFEILVTTTFWVKSSIIL
jgi:hypothetical protein